MLTSLKGLGGGGSLDEAEHRLLKAYLLKEAWTDYGRTDSGLPVPVNV